MDFEKLKTAAEEITLSEEEKEKIISACEEAKKNKKKNRLIPAAAVAAVAVFAVVMFAPGFLFRAKSENLADAAFPMENAKDSVYLYTDELEADEYYVDIQQSASGTREYRAIYYEIPAEFKALVSETELTEWESVENDRQDMPMLRFIEDFEISREDFEAANADYAQRLYEESGLVPLLRAADCAEQESAEIFNTELIFSYDSEKINEYYLIPDYEFNSMGELSDAIANGYIPISEGVSEDYYKE